MQEPPLFWHVACVFRGWELPARMPSMVFICGSSAAVIPAVTWTCLWSRFVLAFKDIHKTLDS